MNRKFWRAAQVNLVTWFLNFLRLVFDRIQNAARSGPFFYMKSLQIQIQMQKLQSWLWISLKLLAIAADPFKDQILMSKTMKSFKLLFYIRCLPLHCRPSPTNPSIQEHECIISFTMHIAFESQLIFQQGSCSTKNQIKCIYYLC